MTSHLILIPLLGIAVPIQVPAGATSTLRSFEHFKAVMAELKPFVSVYQAYPFSAQAILFN